jgi:formylmethanofuran dehydrogenase subunit D
MAEITTIVADITGSGAECVYAHESLESVIEQLGQPIGGFVKCDSQYGEIYVSIYKVNFVAKGRKLLPVGASPGASSLREHQHIVGRG